ncbi:hypothetical protein [uncultured Aquimarina sp.]|uniref:hypothetical protein n=1 Tax=uncultured Aquimarina sp. TaxID=575652 RepID=UPI002602281E|nr:hypothetical protein [uncultured Aquimarina sp.]
MKRNRTHINRKEFVLLSSKLALFSILAPYQNVIPNSKVGNDTELKRQLIEDIQTFFQSKMNFTTKNFYKNFTRSNQMTAYLYISKPDKIQQTEEFSKYVYYGNSSEKATTKKKELDALGYHTLLYKTAGTMLTLLTDRLLSYSMESISFIAFHELTHKYIKKNSTIPYEIEETTCDIIANYESLDFSNNYRNLNTEKVKHHIKSIEQIKKIINRFYSHINSHKDANDIYKICENEIFDLTKDKGLFLRDRYQYPVNNAYFLRTKSYSYDYFTLKKLFQNESSTKEFLDLIIALPNDYNDAISTVKNLLK